MATFVNAKVIEVAYETDFVMDNPNMVDILMPGWNIGSSGTATSPSHVTNIRMFYNGSWENVDLPTYFNPATGAFTYSNFIAVLGVEVLTVEVTWANGTVISKDVNFQVLAA